MKKEAKINANSILIGCVAGILIITAFVFAQTSGSANNANLTIWDDTDNTQIIWKSGDNIFFYANYTNSTSGAVVSDGNCSIRFENSTSDFEEWFNMSFNASSNQFEYNRTFDYKGTFNFEVNCTNSSSMNINLTDSFTISNTPAVINTNDDGTVDIDGNPSSIDYWQCTEDVLCIYNASSNVTEPDTNDVLTFNYSLSSNTTLTNFTLNSSTGILEINITTDADVGSGNKQLELTVTDTDGPQSNGILKVNITAVNDPPQFQTLENWSFNMSELFEKIINVTDEENNIPFELTINFTSCAVAEWSTRNCSTPEGRELFNSSQYTFNKTTGVLNISFTPTRNDVGSYIINFSVMDNSSLGNKTTSQIVNFTVLNVNSAPYFQYVCDNERNATEDAEFTCFINASDIDEVNNLTFAINYTWFTFNSTGTNSTSVIVNSSTDFNGTAMINFTPSDSEVGNWSVNVTVIDTGSPVKANSTIIWFYISNIDDNVTLFQIDNMTAYTSNNYTIYVNASDDDLLIPDKSVYSEYLNFTSNESSWVQITSITTISGTNISQAKVDIYPSLAPQTETNYSINITVRDNSSFIDSTIFVIQILNNTAPVWNETTETNFSLTEDSNFYLNLSQNVTDAENDAISFSYSSDSLFPSFSIDASTGVINFTPTDADVGEHIVTINASDGVTPTSLVFNFTINNTNDNPLINALSGNNITPGSGITNGSSANVTEDSAVELYLRISDDDLNISASQIAKGFYNESFTINLTIQGPNTSLFSFSYNTFLSPNTSQYMATFTPKQADIGSYNITINVTDNSNSSDELTFTLNVLNTQDAPVITNISNATSAINQNFFTDINATDEEDGNETTGNLTYSYAFINGNDFINNNESVFNTTSGVLNITFNSTQGGVYVINFSVNDTSGLVDSFLWEIKVYDYPVILSPPKSFLFSMVENETYTLNFTVNHTVQDNLTYEIIINGISRNSTSGYGNGTEFLWNFTSNFTDETTCLAGQVANLTLNVSNEKLSNMTTWNVTINHTNFPLQFTTNIQDTTATSLTLSNYFNDVDAADPCYNQTIGFTYTLVPNSTSGGSITVTITNWTNGSQPTINFSASQTSSANYSITAFEYENSSYTSSILNNVTSNNFSVTLTVTTTTTPSTGGGGGGGSTSIKPLSLKIIVPGPISSKKKDKLIIPIALENTGKVDLKEIVLKATISKNNIKRTDLVASFDNSIIDILKVGERKNLTLIVDVNTQEAGTYEVTINATVKNPEYNDWAKIFINVEETERVRERILFTEEFIIGNPECAELKEVVDEAKDYAAKGNIKMADKKLNEALEACKKAIEQPPLIRAKKKLEEYLFNYAGLMSIILFIIGFIFYSYKRERLRRIGA